jgi:hypothetical protein
MADSRVHVHREGQGGGGAVGPVLAEEIGTLFSTGVPEETTLESGATKSLVRHAVVLALNGSV